MLLGWRTDTARGVAAVARAGTHRHKDSEMATVFTYYAIAVVAGVIVVWALVWFNTRQG